MPEFRSHAESEYRRLEAERAALQPLVTRCSLCGWSYTGQAGEACQEAAQHRREAHPEIQVPSRRRTRSLKRFRQAELTDNDVAEIDTERRRRARLIGIELSGDTE